MAFYRTQYETMKARLEAEIYNLIRRRKDSRKNSPEPMELLRKAARRGDKRAILALIDTDHLIKLAKKRAIYDRMDLADVLVGATARQLRDDEIEAYRGRLQEVVTSALDDYISTGEPPDVSAVVGLMKAVK